jgi:hypothetical protein
VVQRKGAAGSSCHSFVAGSNTLLFFAFWSVPARLVLNDQVLPCGWSVATVEDHKELDRRSTARVRPREVSDEGRRSWSEQILQYLDTDVRPIDEHIADYEG